MKKQKLNIGLLTFIAIALAIVSILSFNILLLEKIRTGKGLILELKFEEPPAQDIFYDSSPSKLKAISHSSHVPRITTEGIEGSALYFDGKDDYLIIENNRALNLKRGFTVSVWFKAETDSIQLPLISWQSEDGSGVHIWTNALGYQWHLPSLGQEPRGGTGINLVDTTGNDRDYVVSTPNPELKDRWHNLVVAFDNTNGQASIFLDGELKKSRDIGQIKPRMDYDVYIGYSLHHHDARFKGIIDEISIYDRKLPNELIEAKFRALEAKIRPKSIPDEPLEPLKRQKSVDIELNPIQSHIQQNILTFEAVIRNNTSKTIYLNDGYFMLSSADYNLNIWGVLPQEPNIPLAVKGYDETVITFNLFNFKWNHQTSSVWPHSPLAMFIEPGVYHINYNIYNVEEEDLVYSSKAITVNIR